jgi:hypothetical protein
MSNDPETSVKSNYGWNGLESDLYDDVNDIPSVHKYNKEVASKATCSNRYSDGSHCGLCDYYKVYP